MRLRKQLERQEHRLRPASPRPLPLRRLARQLRHHLPPRVPPLHLLQVRQALVGIAL